MKSCTVAVRLTNSLLLVCSDPNETNMLAVNVWLDDGPISGRISDRWGIKASCWSSLRPRKTSMRFNLPRYWNCLQTILFVVCLIKTYRLLAKDLISAVFVPPWTSFDVSETMAMVVLALILAVAAGSLAVDREPRIWQHELKKTYCQMIERQRRLSFAQGKYQTLF